MSQPIASQRVARSTRAAAPVYAAHAASVARGQARTAAAAENNSSGSESDDAADDNDDDTPAQQRKPRRSRTTSSAGASLSASSSSVHLEHAEPLQVTDRAALVDQTRRLLLWKLGDEDEDEGDRKEEEEPQQSNEVRRTHWGKLFFFPQTSGVALLLISTLLCLGIPSVRFMNSSSTLPACHLCCPRCQPAPVPLCTHWS